MKGCLGIVACGVLICCGPIGWFVLAIIVIYMAFIQKK
jgi:hypothetical protein